MTKEIPIINSSLYFGAEGYAYPSLMASELTSLTYPKRNLVIVLPYPTGNDNDFIEGTFVVPQDYSSNPVLVIRGVLDGTPANVLAFTSFQVAVADTEAVDVNWETEDIASNSAWTGYADEDMYEETITLTPSAAYQPGDIVLWRLSRDDSEDTTTFNFLLVDLSFRYTEA